MPNLTCSADGVYVWARGTAQSRLDAVTNPRPHPCSGDSPDKANHRSVPVPRRLWKRERIVRLEQQPEWKERRAQLGATALSVYRRDMPVVRAARRRDNKKLPKQ